MWKEISRVVEEDCILVNNVIWDQVQERKCLMYAINERNYVCKMCLKEEVDSLQKFGKNLLQGRCNLPRPLNCSVEEDVMCNNYSTKSLKECNNIFKYDWTHLYLYLISTSSFQRFQQILARWIGECLVSMIKVNNSIKQHVCGYKKIWQNSNIDIGWVFQAEGIFGDLN